MQNSLCNHRGNDNHFPTMIRDHGLSYPIYFGVQNIFFIHALPVNPPIVPYQYSISFIVLFLRLMSDSQKEVNYQAIQKFTKWIKILLTKLGTIIYYAVRSIFWSDYRDPPVYSCLSSPAFLYCLSCHGLSGVFFLFSLTKHTETVKTESNTS